MRNRRRAMPSRPGDMQLPRRERSASTPPRSRRSLWAWLAGIVSALLIASLTQPVQNVVQSLISALPGAHPYAIDVRVGAGIIAADPADQQMPDGLNAASGQQYFFPSGKLQQAATPPGPGPSGCYGSHAWAVANGGLDYDITVGDVLITARKELVVRSLRVEAELLPVTPGDVTTCPVGGPLDVTHLAVNLDTGRTRLIPSDTQSASTVPEVFGFELEPGQTQRVLFTATSGQERRIRWRLQLEAVSDGKSFDIPIDNDGQPFELVTGRNPMNKQWVHGASGWELAP